MYLQLLNYVSYFLIVAFVAFIVLVCSLIDWKTIKHSWKLAEEKTMLKRLEKKVEKAKQKGETRYEFNHGKTVVYGKDFEDAYDKFKILQREARAVKNQLKKA